MKNLNLGIVLIKNSVDGYSEVVVSRESFDAMRGNDVPMQDIGWDAAEGGDYVRKFDFNGTEVTSLYNGEKRKTRYFVEEAIAKKLLASRKFAKLPFNKNAFAIASVLATA